MNHPHQSVCQDYLELFETLTPERIDEFDALVSSDIHFRDPFNDVRSVVLMKAILRDMFERSTNPRFSVIDFQLEEGSAFVRWHFSAEVPVLPALNVEGVSRLSFDQEGKVCEHLDYWDASPLYLGLPLIGRLLKRIKAKMALPSVGRPS